VKAYRALAQADRGRPGARENSQSYRAEIPRSCTMSLAKLSLTVPLHPRRTAQALAALAVATLEQAVAAGWRNAVRTGGDPPT